MAFVLLLVALILLQVFSIIANERRREYAILIMLGSTRKKLMGVILRESIAIGLAGGLGGMFLSTLVVFPFRTLIHFKLGMPYLQSGPTAVLAMGISVLLLVLLLVALVAALAARKVGYSETYSVLREA